MCEKWYECEDGSVAEALAIAKWYKDFQLMIDDCPEQDFCPDELQKAYSEAYRREMRWDVRSECRQEDEAYENTWRN